MNKHRYSDPAVLIPEHWSAEEALVVVSFLQRITDAIWAAHGHDMASTLYRCDDLSHGAPLNLPRTHSSTPQDDDLPF